MKYTRKQTVLALSALVVVAFAGYGVWKGFPRLFNKYAGLTTYSEVQMDDATRILIQQRIATAQASLSASQESGEKIDMNLYLTIAENERFLGDLIASREAYETYLQLNPVSHTGWNSYAKILDLMGDYAPAEQAFQKAIALYQGESYYRDFAEFLQIRYPERLDDYKKVLDDAFPNIGQTPWIMIALGDWDFTHGDCEQGRDHYAVAKTLAPDSAAQIQSDSDEKYAACQK